MQFDRYLIAIGLEDSMWIQITHANYLRESPYVETSSYTILCYKQKGAPIIQIDDFVEEKSASRGTREACAHELWPVGEIGVAGGAGEQATATDVLEKYHSHLER